jgi:beta-lactamase class D
VRFAACASGSLLIVLALAGAGAAAGGPGDGGSCFLLHDEASGRTTSDPSPVCSTRLTPASTFKIPHALAALDARVVSGPHEIIRYDGSPQDFARWKTDHDLASAMRDSVVWYFQRVAERLGAEREREYLAKFEYGNRDAGGRLTSFWLDGPLRISPQEQLSFLQRFFAGRLPVREDAARAVREILRQPEGRVVNAAGAHDLAAPWPIGTTVSAKTGRGRTDGRLVTWLVGRVTREGRGWIFVSCVVGDAEPLAAVKLAGERLGREGVL